MNDLSRQLERIRAGQEDHAGCNLGRLPWSTHRACELLDRIGRHRSWDQRCPDRTWSNCVDTDSLVDELVGKTSRERDDGTFRGSVVEEIGTANVGVDRGVVDDCVALAHVWEDVFGEVEECCSDVS